MRKFLAAIILVPWCSVASAVNLPALPDATLMAEVKADMSFVLPACTGANTVTTAAELTTVINAAASGSTICLQAGVTFSGHFKLRGHKSSYVTLRSTEANLLPQQGRRVSPSDASHMAKLISPDKLSAIMIAPNSSRWRLVGLEITTAVTAGDGAVVGRIGVDGAAEQERQLTLAAMPHHVIIDRCYFHGSAVSSAAVSIGLPISGWHVAVMGSYFKDFRDSGGDNQAILIAFTTGKIIIENNFVEASGENIMVGGSDSPVPNIPENIIIRGNHIWKDPARIGYCNVSNSYGVKNIFELKVGRKILIEGNIFENYWNTTTGSNQANCGSQWHAVVIKTANQGPCCQSGCPYPDDPSEDTGSYNETSNLTFRYNKFVNIASGLMLARAAACWSELVAPAGHKMHVHNNLFTGLGTNALTTQIGVRGTIILGYPFRIGDHYEGPSDMIVEHNTVAQPVASVQYLSSEAVTDTWGIQGGGYVQPYSMGLVFRDNIVSGTPSMKGAVNDSTASTYWPGNIFQKNVIVSGTTNLYTSSNFYRPNYTGLFASASNYRLASGSPYANAATDGNDVGADIDALEICTAGVTTGTWTGCSSGAVTTVDITADDSDGPITVTPGTAVRLAWSATNATGGAACQATAVPATAAWSGSRGASGSQIINPIANVEYSISCTGATTGQDRVTVNVSSVSVCGRQYTWGDPTVPVAQMFANRFAYNIVEDGPWAMQYGVQMNNAPRYAIRNNAVYGNLFRRIDCNVWGGCGGISGFLGFTHGVPGTSFERNSIIDSQNAPTGPIQFENINSAWFNGERRFRGNIWPKSASKGIVCGTTDGDTATTSCLCNGTACTTRQWGYNVLAGANKSIFTNGGPIFNLCSAASGCNVDFSSDPVNGPLFHDWTRRNLKIRASHPAFHGGPDGESIGVDYQMLPLIRTAGGGEGPDIEKTNNEALFSWWEHSTLTAYDLTCSLEVSTTRDMDNLISVPGGDPNTFTDIHDSLPRSGNRRFIKVTGLSAGTTYWYRMHCGPIYEGSFVTAGSAGSSRDTSRQFKSALTGAYKLHYGSVYSRSTGNVTSSGFGTSSCTAGQACTVSVTVPAGIYWTQVEDPLGTRKDVAPLTMTAVRVDNITVLISAAPASMTLSEASVS